MLRIACSPKPGLTEQVLISSLKFYLHLNDLDPLGLKGSK